MTDQPSPAAKADVPDYSETLFLPKTDFPMRAGLPQREPLLQQRWREIDLRPAPPGWRRAPALRAA
jgi:isoleucyl-tRNA synthetase